MMLHINNQEVKIDRYQMFPLSVDLCAILTRKSQAE